MQALAGRRIAVAIVNYRTADMVIAGLPALLDALAPCAERAVVVVDNDSPDQGADPIAAFIEADARCAPVRLVRAPRNGGFAYGNNRAFEAIAALDWTPEHILLLNPDAALRPGALAALVAVMDAHPRAGIVGASLENAEGVRRGAAYRFPSPMREFANGSGIGALRRLWPGVVESGSGPMRVDWVTGSAMLIRAETLRAIGGMDEEYFLYYEEVDFMRKATLAGWEIWHAPDARVYHEAGGATGMVAGQPKQGGMPAYWFDSWLRYFMKNHGAATARIAAAMKLGGTALGIAWRRARGRPAGIAPGFLGDFARRCLFAPAPRLEAADATAGAVRAAGEAPR